MKILLVGDYSRVFLTLKEGLEKLDQNVVLVSGGDLWKNFYRDIDISGKNSKIVLMNIIKNIPRLINFDVIQLVNPAFFFSGEGSLWLNKKFYNFLKTFNKKTFLSAIGDDYVWVSNCLNGIYRYSPLNNSNNKNESHFKLAMRWLEQDYKNLNEFIANYVRKIISGLTEYYMAYQNSEYKDKLTFIPLPINVNSIKCDIKHDNGKIKFLLGKQRNRVYWKGMDILEQVFLEYQKKYPNDIELFIADSIPYNQYINFLKTADVVVDQLYSYSPAMNALTAMAMGKIVMGGGEKKYYELLDENDNFPTINLIPNKTDIKNKIEYLLNNRNLLEDMKIKSRIFIEKHHDYRKIAEKYLSIWNN